jgi:hypothetical protein
MKDQVFPYQVCANDTIITTNGKEVVFLIEIFINQTTVIRFKSGRKIICYSNEVLEVITSKRSFSNYVKSKKEYNQ